MTSFNDICNVHVVKYDASHSISSMLLGFTDKDLFDNFDYLGYYQPCDSNFDTKYENKEIFFASNFKRYKPDSYSTYGLSLVNQDDKTKDQLCVTGNVMLQSKSKYGELHPYYNFKDTEHDYLTNQYSSVKPSYKDTCDCVVGIDPKFGDITAEDCLKDKLNTLVPEHRYLQNKLDNCYDKLFDCRNNAFLMNRYEKIEAFEQNFIFSNIFSATIIAVVFTSILMLYQYHKQMWLFIKKLLFVHNLWILTVYNRNLSVAQSMALLSHLHNNILFNRNVVIHEVNN